MSSQRVSSSYTPSHWKYDVFLSFRGEDTRKNFTDHLYTALTREGINVFKDDKDLARGKLILPELLQAIEDSEFLIIVFSKNYASSTWCLDELVKIAECINRKGQTIFPIFYNVEPSVVRKQMGAFEEAFTKHEETFRGRMDKVQIWREALRKVTGISGWDTKDRYEIEIIQDIVKEISSKLSSSTCINLEELVGQNSWLEELSVLMGGESNDVRMIGIWGMGGIGKTTIARRVYDLISFQFEGRCFLANIRETTEKGNLHLLQEQLLSETLKEIDVKIWNVDNGAIEIRKRLQRKKVLIVLDDVAHVNQLDKLAGGHGWFGPGSRIIITTRDAQLLHGVNHVYKAKTLNDDDALRLFCLKAFKNYLPPCEYLELSKSIVKYTGGLPLALKVLGSFLFGRNVEDWKSALERLNNRDFEPEIGDVLQISFDGLKETEKNIFLDIACFFKGKSRGYVTRILDTCGFSSTIGISVLIKKSLINISTCDKLWMHDLLQEMGQQIVERESHKEPGKRSRLWKEEDIYHVLTNNTGTKVVEGIMLDSPKTEVHCSANAFSKMINLRLLKISNVQISEGRLDYLSHKLVLFDWKGYPLESLPPKLQLDKVVELNLDGSRLKRMPEEIKPLNKITSISFEDCQYLIKLPDLHAPNLERVTLKGCKMLCEIDPAFLLHEKISYLSMSSCTSLTTLPNKIHMKELEILDLSFCSKLKNFPEVVESMDKLRGLYLSDTAITDLPSSVKLLPRLNYLSLTGCENLVRLPVTINALKYLRHLGLGSCSKVENLSETFGQVESLTMLEACGTEMTQPMSSFFLRRNIYEVEDYRFKYEGLPSNPLFLHSLINLMRRSSNSMAFRFLRLTWLNLSCCNLGEGAIPSDFFDSFPSLECLWLSENNFVSLPGSISHLSRLERLVLDGCERLRSLPELPSNIQSLAVNGCVSLEDLSNALLLFNLKLSDISCVNCFKLIGCKYSLIFSMLKEHLNKAVPKLGDRCDMMQQPCTSMPVFSVVVPGSEIPEWFSHQSELSKITDRSYMGEYIRIEWPPHFCNRKLSGFVVACVFYVRKHPPTPLNGWGTIHCLWKAGERSVIRIPVKSGQALSEHLWLLYFPRHSLIIHNDILRDLPNRIEFVLNLRLSSRAVRVAGEALVWKVGGVHPIYEDDVEEFKKIDNQSRCWNVNDSPPDLAANQTLNQILSVQGLWGFFLFFIFIFLYISRKLEFILYTLL